MDDSIISVKTFKVSRCERSEVEDFIERLHYSHNLNGVKTEFCFSLYKDDILIGAMVLAKLGMANAWKKYGKEESLVIELRRLVCIDDTPKNTESYFIGNVLRWLKKNTLIEVVVSYADPTFGHSGIIYKASNFKMVGKSSVGKVILFNGRRYHDKTIRTYYNGKLKPYAEKIKNALDSGEAVYQKTEGKNIYTYQLRRKIISS